MAIRENFPKDWDDNTIQQSLLKIAGDTKLPRERIVGLNSLSFPRIMELVDGVYEGHLIRVIVEPEDRGILTGYELT